MAIDELRPTEQEVYKWVLSAVKHSIHVEYYLKKFEELDELDLKFYGGERPHDLIGPGNKLELETILGFATQWRKPDVESNPALKKAIELHRQQYHHIMWNGEKPSPDASESDLWFGAIDSVCSLLEPRDYQGGIHTGWDEIIEIANKNPPQKKEYLLKAIDYMKCMQKPELDLITSLSNIQNIGLDQHVYDMIIARKDEAIKMLEKHGYDLTKM